MMIQKFTKLVLLAGLAITIPSFANAEESLIANGDFETDANSDSLPDGWPKATDNVQYVTEDNNHFLRLVITEPGKNIMVYRQIMVKPEHKQYELSYRVRFKDIKAGAQQWFDGRIMMNFKDAEKKVLKPAPKHPNFRGSSDGWASKTQTITVPEGAKTLEIMPTLFQAAAGTLEFDDFKLVPVQTPAQQ